MPSSPSIFHGHPDRPPRSRSPWEYFRPRYTQLPSGNPSTTASSSRKSRRWILLAILAVVGLTQFSFVSKTIKRSFKGVMDEDTLDRVVRVNVLKHLLAERFVVE